MWNYSKMDWLWSVPSKSLRVSLFGFDCNLQLALCTAWSLSSVLTDPIPPIDIFANTSLITTQSVALEWSKPLNTRFQGYQIFYSRLDEAGLQPVNVSLAVVPDASLTSFNVTGLTSGAKYAFRMKSLIEDVASVETPPVLQCTRKGYWPWFVIFSLVVNSRWLAGWLIG